jgi:hypothetical protein
LLKVEELHALTPDVYYGRRRRINAGELHEQMNSWLVIFGSIALDARKRK